MTQVDEPSQDRRSWLFTTAADELLDRLKALGELTRSAGNSTLGALPNPVPRAAADVLSSLRGVVDQVPPPTAAVDLFLEEVKAKKALVQALQVQLASFENQLDVMERSLAPLQAWGRQWSSVHEVLLDALGPRSDGNDPPRRG